MTGDTSYKRTLRTMRRTVKLPSASYTSLSSTSSYSNEKLLPVTSPRFKLHIRSRPACARKTAGPSVSLAILSGKVALTPFVLLWED